MARALFEHLALTTRKALAVLEQAGGFSAASLLCVGGGSKNRLWNQIRADVLNRPLRVVDRKETTALGAACFALPATGAFREAREARDAAGIARSVVEPGPDTSFYADLEPTP
jgi:L-fuculokinase